MNPLQSRLASLRRRLRMLVLGRGLSLVMILVVGCGLAACLLDWFVRLPSPIRAFLLVSILGCAGAVAYIYLIAPLRAKVDDLTLALRIEDENPQLNDALASTVQFLQQPADSPTAGSASMRKEAVQRALRQAQECDFDKIVDRRGVRLAGLAVLAILVLTGFLYFTYPSLAQTALLRLAEPFGNHTWTRVAVADCPTRIAEKQPFVLRAKIEGIIPAQARIELEGTAVLDKNVAIKFDAKTNTGTLEVAPVDMTQQRTTFKFRIWANDGVYPSARGWHEVEVLPPPSLVALNGLPSPQIELHYPAYTDLPSPHKLPAGTRHLEAVAGTAVTLRAATDRELTGAWVEYAPEKQTLKPAAIAGFLGQLNPWSNLGSLAGGCQAWGRFPARLESDRKKFTVHFQPWISGSYILHLHDAMNLDKDFESDLRVVVDPPPVVLLDRPASNQSVLPDAKIRVLVRVEDDITIGPNSVGAIRSLYLEYRRKNSEGQWLDAQPRRLPLYDAVSAGRAGPPLLSALAMNAGQGLHMLPTLVTWKAAELHAPQVAFRLRPKQLVSGRSFSLDGLVKLGDILVIQAVAEDFNDVYLNPIPGRSHEVELRIVGKQELAKLVDEGLAQIQQQLVRAQQMQEEAQQLVRDVQKQKNQPNPKELDPKARAEQLQKQLDKIVEAEQIQKQIQERLGTKEDQGVRAELAKLQQMLKDNNMPQSNMEDRLRKVANELERLTQEELQQIEPNLAEARKELARDPKPMPPPKEPMKESKQDKGPLDKAQKHQDEAKKTIDELVKFLDPWANMHLVKGKAREILQKQNELRRETQKIEEEIANLFRDKMQDIPLDKREQWKADLEKHADAQQNLKERAQDLLNMMEQMQQKRGEQGDKHAADLLKEARKEGEPSPEKMQQAKDDLKKAADGILTKKDPPPLNKVAKEQQDAAQKIENALAALEERRDKENVDLLRKKNKKFQEKVDDLADKQELLQKKAKNVQDMADPEKRDQEMKQIAKELEEIKANMANTKDPKRLKDLAEQQDRLQKKAKQNQELADPEKRAQELKDLAREQELLREETEKTRELARLEGDRASKDLGKAAQEMEKAAKQLANGENPQDAMEQALERLEGAQQQLEQEEEQLAREQLEKIADQIKGLKERQEAAIKEMERIHKGAIDVNKKWTSGLKSSLGDLARTQKGLGQETESLNEKLKDAMVFAHILKRAAKGMDQAGDAMEERRKNVGFQFLEDDDIKGQAIAQEATIKLQTDALRRLDRLLDALKQELAKHEKKDPMEGGGGGGEQQGGLRAQDGIPAMAQLKALREEQQEINDRTKAFAERHPGPNPQLNDAQRQELREIQVDQEKLQNLFQQMTTPKELKGDNP